MLLAVPFGLAIGLVVGAVGGGGAILALPVLVYVLGEGVGQVCRRLALLFSAQAAAGSLLGAVATRRSAARCSSSLPSRSCSSPRWQPGSAPGGTGRTTPATVRGRRPALDRAFAVLVVAALLLIDPLIFGGPPAA